MGPVHSTTVVMATAGVAETTPVDARFRERDKVTACRAWGGMKNVGCENREYQFSRS